MAEEQQSQPGEEDCEKTVILKHVHHFDYENGEGRLELKEYTLERMLIKKA